MSGNPVRVLDKGFVRLVDHIGDDKAIVEAARVSISGERVQAVSSDRDLIRYLMRKSYWGPFDMTAFKFHISAPIFIARQWARDRSASIAEISGRFSVLPEEYYVPEARNLQLQADKGKQGRSGIPLDPVVAESIQIRMQQDADHAFDSYHKYLDENLAREVSRIGLPLSTYTEWYWKVDLHNLFNFLKVRMDTISQYEIRVYAGAIAAIIKPIVPLAWEAFEDFMLYAMTLSRVDIRKIKELITEHSFEDDFPSKREADEFEEKIVKLGISH